MSTTPAQQVSGNVRCVDTEPPTSLSGVTVVAVDFFTGQAQTTVTDANGDYSMALVFGFYTISLEGLPDGSGYVSPAGGYYQDFFSSGIQIVVNFSLNGCGSVPSGEIGDFVWQDLNCDGIQDWDEPGMPGVAVLLTDCDGTLLAETTTDADGHYLFSELDAGDYAVEFVLPAGFQFSPVNPGAESSMDSDADPFTGRTVCFSVENGEADGSWDAGLCQLPAPGVHGQGYWKNHPEEWPVDEIEIGGITYTIEEAVLTMQLPTKGDKSLNLFEQLVAARLNVLIGNEADCIISTIEAADQWISQNGSPVSAKSNAWQSDGAALHFCLESYNNGLLCAFSAD